MASSADQNDVVTMLDVLNDEKDLSDTASAVLSGSDEKNCNGFVKRQALYSCLTCSPEDAKTDFAKSIGICLACSLHCHDKHELVELYTKRNFHCDCGVKAGSTPCNLEPLKTDQKSQSNKYNQNFAGIYCTCHRPYPDPESTNNDVMIQCIVCEDWYHSLHLKGKVPTASAYDEMICGSCMTKADFLTDYTGLTISIVESEGNKDESSFLNVTSLDESTSSRCDAEEAQEAKRIKLSENACIRPRLDTKESEMDNATFWKEEWRKSLCKCTNCLRTYKEAGVEFLIDLEDTTHFYEEKGKTNERPSFEAASLQALSSLPRGNQIDAITGYNRMKDKLFEFLQTFVVNNQIVTEEDIQRFFRTMKESKEQAPQQPHFCR